MKYLNRLQILAAVALISGAVACVIFTETLGPAGVPIAAGTDFVVAGTGLNGDGPPFPGADGTIEFAVPMDATVVQVLLFWSGQMLNGVPSVNDDDTIVVNGTEITGTLIGGPAFFFNAGGAINVDAYRADVTNTLDGSGAPLVTPGLNVLDVSGLDYFAGNLLQNGNQGAGVIVIYDDGGALSEIAVREGVDLAFCGFPEPRKSMVPQTFSYVPSDQDRTGSFSMFAGSVGQEGSPNVLRITYDVGAPIELVDPLASVDGNFWDSLTIAIPIPAMSTQFTVEPVSGTAAGTCPTGSASMTWIAAAASVQQLPPPPETMACTPGFWKNRAAGQKGLLKFFADNFDDIVAQAVLLSDGFFADGDELIDAVSNEGGAETQARRALAALLLNLAAGDLAPDNGKCELFDDDLIISNSCGENLTVAEALEQILDDIDGGFFTDANECGDEINNNIFDDTMMEMMEEMEEVL